MKNAFACLGAFDRRKSSVKPGRNGRVLPMCLLATLFTAAQALAFEAVGTIREMDAERHLLHIQTENGVDRVVPVAPDVRTLGIDGQALAGGLADGELKAGARVTLVVERGDSGPVVRMIRLGRQRTNETRGRQRPNNVSGGGTNAVGLMPLDQMTAQDRYKGEDGGLYGGGGNDPPPDHAMAARKQTQRIDPLDRDGKPARDGKIGLVSVSMSNATQEFSLFKQLADGDPRKSPHVVIVDCAQGGQAMAEWTRPDARAWEETSLRLERAGVSAKQVQVIWVKLANKGPRGDLASHGRQLQQDTLQVLQNAKAAFPNVRIAYLGSRIYAGYATSPLNPEPYAYEGAFVVRWLIQAQMGGDASLSYDEARGAAKVPLLLWGPYFWADGIVPRKRDGLIWERSDLAGDGTHPSNSGRRKVADMLLAFFKEDPIAAIWFVNEKGDR